MNSDSSKLAVAMAVLVAAPVVQADTLTVGSWTASAGDQVRITSPIDISTRASRFLGNVTSSTLPEGIFVDSKDALYGYCYDVFEYLAQGGNTYEVVFGLNPPNAWGVTQSTLDFLGAVNATIPGGSVYDWLHPTGQWQAAAIQIGIWETLYDNTGPFDLAAGSFQVTGLETETVAALSAIRANSGTIDASWVMVLHAEGRSGGQDVITGRRGPERITRQVPEPATAVLLVAAAAAAGLARRRTTQAA